MDISKFCEIKEIGCRIFDVLLILTKFRPLDLYRSILLDFSFPASQCEPNPMAEEEGQDRWMMNYQTSPGTTNS